MNRNNIYDTRALEQKLNFYFLSLKKKIGIEFETIS